MANTFAGFVLAAYLVYAVKMGQLATLMQILGLSPDANNPNPSGRDFFSRFR